MLSCLLLVSAAPAAPSSARAADDEFGRTWAKDKVLRPGCHDYRYQYRVKPPESEWALETFLLDPNKKKVGAGQMLFNADPERGSSTFRLCRASNIHGSYKIRGKLTYGADDEVVWLEPGRFRLLRAS